MLFLSLYPRRQTDSSDSLVRIVGTDPVEMAGAAQTLETIVNTTRHGIGWFQCPQSQIYKIRERFTLVQAPFAVWMEYARSKKFVNPLSDQPKSGAEETGKKTVILGPEYASAEDYFGVVPCDDAEPGLRNAGENRPISGSGDNTIRANP